MLSNPVIDTQLKHVTVRSFKHDPIGDEMLETILEAGRRSPTSSNLQTYSIIVVKDPEKKQKIAALAGGQQHIIDCPVFLALCPDLHRSEQVCEMYGLEMTNNLETFLISTVDAALVGMSIQTAVESFKLGAVMIGAVRNNLKEVAELLKLPHGVYPVFGMCIGWPVEEHIPTQKPRLPKELVIHSETYKQKDISAFMDLHDLKMAEHYDSLGKNISEHAWSEPVARNLSRPLRPEAGRIIKELGFNI
ncbi:MAG: NADPH-dependent oxidoreductase [Candidatus Marinimicrobia bacterium]|nr:NADPH-dependent oxidoreductase [Candidatus Neomarinimicrobiota bacterium]MCF7904402.1 NADPH-dependent oxidoreductase [Candidatus Neomarinimicrobiota bacterium]